MLSKKLHEAKQEGEIFFPIPGFESGTRMNCEKSLQQCSSWTSGLPIREI